MEEPEAGGAREIRLAMVCFGGVSLAVYMAGITREVQSLVEASRALGTGAAASLRGSAAAYAEALRRRAERDRVPTTVVVDVIAGTSAGGIDGLFLAKGLVTGADQVPLRDIWLEQGDVRRLVRGRGPVPLRLAGFLAKAALRRPDALAPLDGDLLLRHAYRGLRAMDRPGKVRSPRPRPSSPEETTLDLFVTVTDVTGRVRSVSVWDPGLDFVDRTHRYVLHFSGPVLPAAGDGSGDLGQFARDYDAALAFAARSTSSFPGAFPQVRLGEVASVLRPEAPDEIDGQMETLLRELFASYDLEGEDPLLSRYFDGGVLDNFPFEHAISAIQRKPASSEVERYLVVLSPDPGQPRPAEATPAATKEDEHPGWVATLLSGFVGVRLNEPVLDDLFRLRESNERLRQVGELVERLEGRVQRRLDEVVHGVTRDSGYAQVRRVTQEMHDLSETEAAMAWPHYLDLRLEAIAGLLCETTVSVLGYPADSRHAALVRTLLRRLVVDERRAAEGGPSDDFLRRHDLPFRERRLRLTVQTINAEYAGTSVPRPSIDAAKARMYDSLRRLWAVPSAVGALVGVPAVLEPSNLRGWLDRDPAELVEANRAELEGWLVETGAALEAELDGFGQESWSLLSSTLARWPADRAAAVVRSFVGFPLWDITVFPLLAASRVEQFTPVRMRRISPIDATALRADKTKLRGIPLHHFAAFLDRESRENDYVWGRLDAAECLLRLVDDAITAPALAHALRAVVAEESDLAVLRTGGRAGLRAFLDQRLRTLEQTRQDDHLPDPPSGTEVPAT